MVFDHRYLISNETLNPNEVSGFGLITKPVSDSRTPRSCSASDSVDITLRLVGKVVIEHVRNAVNVDASAGDICCNQYWNIASLKSVKSLGSRTL